MKNAGWLLTASLGKRISAEPLAKLEPLATLLEGKGGAIPGALYGTRARLLGMLSYIETGTESDWCWTEDMGSVSCIDSGTDSVSEIETGTESDWCWTEDMGSVSDIDSETDSVSEIETGTESDWCWTEDMGSVSGIESLVDSV